MRKHCALCLCIVSFLVGLLFFQRPVFARTLMKLEEFLKQTYPEATRLEEDTFEPFASMKDSTQMTGMDWDPALDRVFHFYRAYRDAVFLGYAAWHTVEGKWGHIDFAVALTPEGVIEEVVVLKYSEVRGKPVGKKRFLSQFKQKTIQDPLQLGKDVQGVTGATISSTGMTQGVKKILWILSVKTKGVAF